MDKSIAIVILNYIQFVNVKPAIENLIQLGYKVDIYCQTAENDDGFKELFEDNVRTLIKNGFKVYRTSSKSKKYKVLLEPYPSMSIVAKYKIKYRYSAISAKPDVVYGKPENFIIYDAILCSGKYDASYLSAYSKTYITGNMKYINFSKKKISKGKKILLYLPTYGNSSSIDLIADYLPELKKDYYVIAKIHHGTSFLKNEINRIEKVKTRVDEFYDLHEDLSNLLSIADVVLTDNSGSIFEAIYTETPVAVFSDNINQNRWGLFNTTQYELYKDGILPYTNEISKIKDVLMQAQSSKIKKLQSKWNKENFYHPKNQVEDFVKVIEMYLNDDIDKRYYELHTEFKNVYLNILNDNKIYHNQLKDFQEKAKIREKEVNNKEQQLNNKINYLEEKITSLTDQLKYYENGKLYKIANKIYKIKNGDKK